MTTGLQASPNGSSPSIAVLQSKVERLERENQQLLRERNEARREVQQLRRERTALFAALGNQALTVGERIDGVYTLFEAQHNRQNGHEDDPWRPTEPITLPTGRVKVCVTSVARSAGRSPDAVKGNIDRLTDFGLGKTQTVRGYNEETRQPESRVFMWTAGGDLQKDLHALTRLKPPDKERAAVTEKREKKARTKPGPAKGTRREKTIKAACPKCGSEHTSLECIDCGLSFHTADLPDEREDTPNGQEDPGRAQGAVTYGSRGGESREPQPSAQETYRIGAEGCDAQETVGQGPEPNGPGMAQAQGAVTYGSLENGSRTPNLSVLPTSETPFVEAALAYASIGWAVFPINGKIPQIKEWPQKASTDPETIRAWWRRRPCPNIAVACGLSRIVVLDIDREGLESWSDLERKLRLPRTLTARTGGGGLHVIYQAPPHVKLGNSSGKLPEAIHVRGAGGQIVVEPSVHAKSGKRYEWVLESRARIAPFPSALLQLLVPEPRRPRPSFRGTGPLLTTGDPILEGSRNEGLFRLACKWRGQGAGEDAMIDALVQANENRCRPPLGEDEVRRIARGVAANYPAGGGGRDSMSAGDTQRVPEPSPSGVPCRCPADEEDGVIRPCDGCNRDFVSVGGRTHCPLCPVGGPS